MMNSASQVFNQASQCAKSSIDLLSRSHIRNSHGITDCPTQAKVTRVVLNVIAATIAVGGVVAAITIGQVAVCAFSLCSIPFSLFASRIKDYDDPLELQALKQEALQSSWSQLICEHGFDGLSKLFSKEEMRQKFQEDYQNRLFSEIIAECSLATIKRYELDSFSKDSFLGTRFLRELERDRLNTLRRWHNENWGVGSLAYRGMLPAWQMDDLISARRALIAADRKREESLWLPPRVDKRLSTQPSRLSRPADQQVRALGREVQKKIEDSYEDRIARAPSISEKNALRNERDRVAAKAGTEAEARKRKRLESKIL